MASHLYELVAERARRFPDAVAFGGQEGLGWSTLTSRQVRERVDALAAELAARGVGEGDRVALWLPSHPRTPLYLFALWKLGAVAVPFDREMNPEAAVRILASVEPRLVLVGYGERPGWLAGVPVAEWWEPGAAGDGGAGWDPPAEELAAIIFTSGTTGHPKGCMITHANFCAEIAVLGDRVPLDTDCRLASILPLSHLYELTCGLLYPFASGAEIHYIPSRRGPDVVRVLAEQRITHMMAVPQLLVLMGRTLEGQLAERLPAPALRTLTALAPRLPMGARRRLFFPIHRRLGGNIRLLASGGAALPPETQRLWERLGIRVIQGYGASECSPVVAMGNPDGSTPLGSVGMPIRGVAVRLSPEGEALVRGPNVFRGYWCDPERTAEVLRDGWYATGDLARQDAAGNLFLVGRARDLIALPSGMNVWPQDVEEALRERPEVADAAVVAAPTSGGGLALHAYLLPRPPADRGTDVGGIVQAANAHLAQHQRLATASWWPEDDFPRTALGKVRRALLPPPAAQEAVRVESVLAADDPVGQVVAGVAHRVGLRDDQSLAELGLDSLGLVELATLLQEKTGKAVVDGDLRLEMTVEEVRRSLARAPAVEESAAIEPLGPAKIPLWPFTWGGAFRFLDFPVDLAYAYAVRRTIVRGAEHLRGLPPRVILAGTHHGFADMPLVRVALRRSPAAPLAYRLVIATAAEGFERHRVAGLYGMLGFGLYPLHQREQREASLRGLAKLAAKGRAVLIFPQGTHARPEEERAGERAAQFRPGVAHLARALDAAVVPFGVAGTEKVMPSHLEDFSGRSVGGVPLALTPGPLAIAFGPPLRLAPGEEEHDFASRLQAVCFALTRQAEAALAEA